MNRTLHTIALVFFLSMKIYGQWNSDPGTNNAVVLVANKGTSVITSLASTTDGNSGMFIAWIDSRNNATTGPDIFVTRMMNNGEIADGFLPGGNPICTASGVQSGLYIEPDGIGGAILSWNDGRNSGTGYNDVYAQRINGNGMVYWTANGVAISNTILEENTPVVKLISTDKAAIVWRVDRPVPNGLDLFANYVNLNNGSKALSSDIVVVSKNNTQTNQQVLPDGENGFFVVWTDGRVSNANMFLYGQHINEQGTLQWGPPGNVGDGQLIISSAGDVSNPVLAGDGTGGIVVAFSSTRVSEQDANIYAQRVDENGTPVWTANGVPVCVSLSNQSNPRIIKAGPSPNFIIGWADRRHSTNLSMDDSVDIYAQGLLMDGVKTWSLNGIEIVRRAGTQPLSLSRGFEMLGDDLGGAYFVWDDDRSGNSDIFAQRLLTDGTIGWASNGIPVANRGGANQNWETVVRSGDRLDIAWRDSRASPDAEIYASQLLSDGLLPLDILELSAKQDGKKVMIQWTSISEKALDYFEVERGVQEKDFHKIAQVYATNVSGKFVYGFEDLNAAGIKNFYRIKSVDHDGRFAFSNIVQVHYTTNAQNNIYLFPNPARTIINLQFNNMKMGGYVINVLNLQGKLMQNHQIVCSGSHQFFQIPVTKLSGGYYKLVVFDNHGTIIEQQNFIKH